MPVASPGEGRLIDWQCKVCGATSGKAPRYRPATGPDLQRTEADGWPAAPFRAWLKRYGHLLPTLDFAFAVRRVDGGILQSAAVALLEDADER